MATLFVVVGRRLLEEAEQGAALDQGEAEDLSGLP